MSAEAAIQQALAADRNQRACHRQLAARCSCLPAAEARRLYIRAVLVVMTAVSLSCTQASRSAPTKANSNHDNPETQSNSQIDDFAANRIPLDLPLVQPKIVVIKSKRRLMLYSGGKLVRTYGVGLGLSPIEDKIKEGDHRTPEGAFYIFTKNDKSHYYLSLGLSYPNGEDAERGLRDGLIDREQYNEILNAIRKKTAPPQNTALGGEIYIHGNGAQSDWTWGCVALDNRNIRELFDAVPVRTEVIIEH
jgi:murein L,D-transpeptidase YafK